MAVQLPPIEITAPPPVADVGAGVGLGADVGAGASAALAGGGLAGATVGAGPLGLMGLVNAFDPSFFGGDPGASPAQIQQNQLNLATAAGYPGTAAGVQAYINATFKDTFGLNVPQLPAEFSALNQTLPSDVSSLAPTTPDVTPAPVGTPASGGSLFPDPSTVQPGVVPADIASGLTLGGGGSFTAEGTPYEMPTYSLDTPTADRFGDAFTPTADVTAGAPGAQQDLGRAIYSGGQFKGIEGVAPAADTGGAGILGTGVSWGDALRFGGPLAALGMLGATMARGPAPLPQAAQQQVALTGPGSPVYNVSQKYLTEASTGQLQPGETAQIEQYRQNATNQLYQQLANEGVTDPRGDSRFVQGQQAIEQNAQIMYQGFINAAVTNGINALGPTTTALTNAAQLQMEQDQAYRQALASATQAFGVSAALSTIGGARTA
jgi:hypothetical protein